MNILRIAPPVLPISDNLKYAGTERVIRSLHKKQRELGHNVYLAAAGDSEIPEGGLIPTIPKSIWGTQGQNSREIVADTQSMKIHHEKCIDLMVKGHEGIKFDVVHDHSHTLLTTSLEYLSSRNQINIPIAETLHGQRSDNEVKNYLVWRALAELEGKVHFNSISQSQKNIFSPTGIPINRVIYHGVEMEKFPFSDSKQDYLFWIGRIDPSKGLHNAIKVSRETGRPLIVAGEVHSVNEKYYQENIRHNLDNILMEETLLKSEEKRNELVERLRAGKEIVNEGEIYFVGPLNDIQKAEFFSHAYATLVPNEWHEPFGLVMIESMATGTPVIGFGLGSVPEVIGESGKSGYVISPRLKNGVIDYDTMTSEMVEIVNNLKINYRDSRGRVEQNFTAEMEAQNYVKFFEDIINTD